MNREYAPFYSEGYQLDGDFFSDDALSKEKPLVVICSGFTGLKNIHPERFSRFLTKKGYLCYGFDYRGFGKSEGERHRVRLEEQITDISNAVYFVSKRAKQENRKIVLIGWGMAGGMIIPSQCPDPVVSAMVSVNGFYDNIRTQKILRGEAGWQKFLQWFHNEKADAARSKETKMYDPFLIYPLDEQSETYVDNVLRKNNDYGIQSDLCFADSLIHFNVSRFPEKNIPLLVAHGENNKLHPVIEAQSIHDSYPHKKELLWIKDAGHTEWMLDDNPIFANFINNLDRWITANV